jgi:hypothetical protein
MKAPSLPLVGSALGNGTKAYSDCTWLAEGESPALKLCGDDGCRCSTKGPQWQENDSIWSKLCRAFHSRGKAHVLLAIGFWLSGNTRHSSYTGWWWKVARKTHVDCGSLCTTSWPRRSPSPPFKGRGFVADMAGTPRLCRRAAGMAEVPRQATPGIDKPQLKAMPVTLWWWEILGLSREGSKPTVKSNRIENSAKTCENVRQRCSYFSGNIGVYSQTSCTDPNLISSNVMINTAWFPFSQSPHANPLHGEVCWSDRVFQPPQVPLGRGMELWTRWTPRAGGYPLLSLTITWEIT